MREITLFDVYYLNQKLSFPVGRYLDTYYDFYQNNYPNIVNFYLGDDPEISYSNFKKLNQLLDESNKIHNKFIINGHLLKNYFDWELVEYFTELRENLLYVSKIGKFLRSTKGLVNYSSNYEFQYTLGREQTLEEVSNRVLKTIDYNDRWTDIALRNDLKEIDYDERGGNNLILQVNLNTRSANITGVVDFIHGKRAYGIDFKRKLTFENEDLAVLGYEETFKQSVDILTSLEKGDVPEFLDLGRTALPGNNMASFSFVSMIREMIEVFSSDDTMTDFSVIKTDFNPQNNDAFLEFTISSRLELVLNQTLLP